MSIVAGKNDFIDMLKLFSDKDELTRRIELFERKKEEADAAVALVGPAGEILRIRKEIESDIDEARRVLEGARSEAAGIVAAAKKAAEERMHEASAMVDAQIAMRDEAKAQARELTQAATQRAMQADELMQEALRVKADAEERMRKAQEMMLAAQETVDDFKQRKQRLLEVADRFGDEVRAI